MSTTTTRQEKSLGLLSPTDVPLQVLPVVELTGDQLQRVASLARERNESYKAIDGGAVFGDQDSLTNHQIGILGELAVAKLYHADIDPATYEFGDPGSDLTLWGDDVDVKATATTKMDRPDLLVRANGKLTADRYFLTHITRWNSNTAMVRVLGHTTREVVLNRDSEKHPGTRLNYVVKPSELNVPPLIGINP